MLKELFLLMGEIKQETGNNPKIEVHEEGDGHSINIEWQDIESKSIIFRGYISSDELRETGGYRVVDELAEMARG